MGRSLPHTVLAALGLQDTEEGYVFLLMCILSKFLPFLTVPTMNANVTSYLADQA